MSYERTVLGMLEWAQMVKLSRRVSGSKADVADAVLEGIQKVTGTVGCIQ